MVLVYACIAPHGGELIPRLAGKQLRVFSPTRVAMRRMAAQIKKAKPDTIVVASPHSLRLPKHLGVVASENSSGKLADGGREVSMSAKVDLDFARKVIGESERRGLPVVEANYGGLEGPASDLAMDWGTLVPLWFFKEETGLKSKIVIVTPSRGIPLAQNFEFGRVIGETAEGGRKRIAFVASSDQAHAHAKDGPYGFSPKAKEYDDMVAMAIKGGRLESVMSVGPRLVEGAKPDSLWQMTMLAGALTAARFRGTLVSYQVPTYYGMLCASYVRENTPP